MTDKMHVCGPKCVFSDVHAAGENDFSSFAAAAANSARLCLQSAPRHGSIPWRGFWIIAGGASPAPTFVGWEWFPLPYCFALSSGPPGLYGLVTAEHYTNQILDAEVIDVGHSISGRKNKNQRTSAATSAQESPETGLSFNTFSDIINVADLLDIVNSTHRSLRLPG